MTRPRSFNSSFAHVALLWSVTGSVACSSSFKAAGTSTSDGKPTARLGDIATKPIANPDPDVTDSQGEAALDDPPQVVAPRRTAVCRVADQTLAKLCHLVLDPVAADDLSAFEAQLAEGVFVARPSLDDRARLLQGKADIHEAAEAAGGLHGLMHVTRVDRVVGTVDIDCRHCTRSSVSFAVNTRSGGVVVSVDMTQPPQIYVVEIASRVLRPPLVGSVQR